MYTYDRVAKALSHFSKGEINMFVKHQTLDSEITKTLRICIIKL